MQARAGHLMQPAYLVGPRVGVDGALKEEVDAFLEGACVQRAAQAQVDEGLVCDGEIREGG